MTGLTVFAHGRMELKQLELLKEAVAGLTRGRRAFVRPELAVSRSPVDARRGVARIASYAEVVEGRLRAPSWRGLAKQGMAT